MDDGHLTGPSVVLPGENAMRYDHEVGSPGLVRESPAERFHLPMESLRNEELLSVLVECSIEKARHLIETHSLSTLGTASYDDLKKIIPCKRARTLLAAFELSRRIFQKGPPVTPAISCPTDTLPFLFGIRNKEKEHFMVLYLNARNQVIHTEVISIGSLSASIVHPREVFAVALQHCAASIILAHNHPSQDVSPSKDDIELTRRLVKAGEIMGLEVLDHIVISRADFTSLKERGVI